MEVLRPDWGVVMNMMSRGAGPDEQATMKSLLSARMIAVWRALMPFYSLWNTGCSDRYSCWVEGDAS